MLSKFIVSLNRNQRLMYLVEAENKALAVNEATNLYRNIADPYDIQYGEVEIDTDVDVEEV